MRIAVTGATGFVGRALCARLVRDGIDVVALTRNPQAASASLGPAVRCAAWEAGSDTVWRQDVADADAVVHLAGESVGGHRWTDTFRARLRSSRIDTTRSLVEAMAAGRRKPACLISASAVGYYGNRGDAVLTEESSRGDGFLADLCADWETEAKRAESVGIREVRLRLGIVLGRGGGALQQMLYPLPVRVSPWKLGLGGRLGSGRQWVSWIDLLDAVEMIVWAIGNESIHGPLNAVSPNPVTNAELTRGIGAVLHRPEWMAIPAPILKLALGEFADTLLGGQRAVPAVAMSGSFGFARPNLADSLREAIVER